MMKKIVRSSWLALVLLFMSVSYTHLVIGQSSMKRNYFFSRKTLTEKLIDIVPDIDIHIIPDTVKAENYREGHLSLHVEKPSIKECFLTVLIFVICTFIGLVFQKDVYKRQAGRNHSTHTGF